MFINLHVLYSLAGANPNRDDLGAPKTCEFGGVMRSRMSSQSMTRAKRRAYEADPNGELSFRSTVLAAKIADRAADILTASGHPADKEALDRLHGNAVKAVQSLTSNKGTPADADAGGKDEPKATLAWLAEREIDNAARKLAEAVGASTLTADDLAHTRTSSLSIAAFGRMFANRPDLQTEAAIQRADAFTTHRGTIDVDYFTSVDDLLTDSKAAGHIGTKMSTGGVYYWHCNINTSELLANWTDATSEHAGARLAAMTRALLLALPSGGENTHAHHALPIAALAVPAHCQRNLASSFETPVRAGRDGGYIDGSIEALSRGHASALRFDPKATNGTAVSATLNGEAIAGSEPADSIDALTERIVAWIIK